MAGVNELAPGGRLRPMTPLESQMHEDVCWATEHHAELHDRYPGESLVVWKQQIVAHGSDEATLLDEAARAGFPREELVVIENPPFFECPP